MNFQEFGSLSQSDFVFVGEPTCESAFGLSRIVSAATPPDESVPLAVSELEPTDGSEELSTVCESNARGLPRINAREKAGTKKDRFDPQSFMLSRPLLCKSAECLTA
jgi:hypothetical protein